MADGNGHTVTAKAHITAGPGQVAGEVIDVTDTCAAGRGCGVIPVAFQTAVVTEEDLQSRHMVWIVAIIRRIELFPVICGSVLYSIIDTEHHAIVGIFIPAANNIRHIPHISCFCLCNLVVFYDGIVGGFVCPCQGAGLPRP